MIYLILIWNTFPPLWCRQRKSGKGPWTALATVTKQYWNFPCCSIKCRLLGSSSCQSAKEGGAELAPGGLCTGEQILQQLEVQQHLNSQRRNTSRKLTPFSPLPMLEGNPGQWCSITDCSSRHACREQVWRANWEIHLQKTTHNSRLPCFSKPCIIWSHINKYKTFHYNLSHTAHPSLPPSQSYSSWKKGQLLNRGEMILTISTLSERLVLLLHSCLLRLYGTI